MRRLTLSLLPVLAAGVLVAGSGVAREVKTERPTDEERGRELYDRHCESCHGAWAKGRGPATQALVHEVPDLEGKIEVDDALIQLVLRGKGAMPAYEQTFDRFDAKRVLDHMARLRKPDPSAIPAEDKPADPPEEPTEAPDDDGGAPPADQDNAPPE